MSLNSFRDIPPILNAALAAGGARYVCETRGAAIVWRARAYKYRKALLRQSAERYAHIPGYEPTTPYDALVLRIARDDEKVVEIGFAAGPGVLLDKDGKPLEPQHNTPQGDDLDEAAKEALRDLDLG